jgi:hypothetical protein
MVSRSAALVQAGDVGLLVGRQRDARHLLAVAERRVEERYVGRIEGRGGVGFTPE